MPGATYPTLGFNTDGFVVKELLAAADYVSCLQRYCKPITIPKGETKKVNLARPNNFSVSTTAATEGVTPATEAFSFTSKDATLAQYVRIAEVTDQAIDLSKREVLTPLVERLGMAFGQTFEQLTWMTATGGASVFFGNGVDRTSVTTELSASILRRATVLLKSNKAKQIGKLIAAGPLIDTTPVGKAYYAFGHTDMEVSLRTILGDAFTPVEKYSSAMKAEEGEVGKFENIRFILSPEFKPVKSAAHAVNAAMRSTGGKVDIYQLLILGEDAVGTVMLKGDKAQGTVPVKPSIIPVNSPSAADPAGQRGYVSCKGYFASLILNDEWMTRVEVCVSN
ncbi:N4-gp56 family major capsid protein [Deefgea sp. CFH1-16]|uniref:N4-gp56 family major capsid protein n=1 Tax=Deefgea sp. CFH1-16 TaxID=2675457 RepID=UPI0015F4E85B|nr:N4-gp56 family major capsid protein [Deefgea sp. CFH1-16]MBM5575828.1 N4-gp56 family major capsid protein [Deefgea sp. CFH1-16]